MVEILLVRALGISVEAVLSVSLDLVFKPCSAFDVLGWFLLLGVFVTLVYVFCGVLHLWFFFPKS